MAQPLTTAPKVKTKLKQQLINDENYEEVYNSIIISPAFRGL